MNKVYCSIEERYVNPLFEVFDGGDFILSSYRDIEEKLTQVQIYFPEADRTEEAKRCLGAALSIVGVSAPIEVAQIPDGTGKHETTRACLEFIDELADQGGSFLDMGCGSGILSIAAAKLGFSPVFGFDVDQEAVDASVENAAFNGVKVDYVKYGLGARIRRELPKSDLVAANILGPLLIRFAPEIVPCVGRRLIISGILTELYPEVLKTYESHGLREVGRKTFGEWTTGLLARPSGR